MGEGHEGEAQSGNEERADFILYRIFEYCQKSNYSEEANSIEPEELGERAMKEASLRRKGDARREGASGLDEALKSPQAGTLLRKQLSILNIALGRIQIDGEGQRPGQLDNSHFRGKGNPTTRTAQSKTLPVR